MINIEGRSAEQGYLDLLNLAVTSEIPFTSSRVAPVRDLGPATIEIASDSSRIFSLKERGFNPVFAFVEASWLLDGSQEILPLKKILKNFGEFSDDGETLNGAYGYRMRKTDGVDQLAIARNELKLNPDSRRIVISLWNSSDLGDPGKDVPCNTHVYLKIRCGKLDITVCNRSNDLWWGIPYNIFIFRALQLKLAYDLDIEVGTQVHFTDSLHLYQRDEEAAKRVCEANGSPIPYADPVEKKLILSSDFSSLYKNQSDIGFLSEAVRESWSTGRWNNSAERFIKDSPEDSALTKSVSSWLANWSRP